MSPSIFNLELIETAEEEMSDETNKIKKNMSESWCFIHILEYLGDSSQDFCKLQLLNKRTY